MKRRGKSTVPVAMRRRGGKSKGEDYDYDYDWYIILLAKIADKIWSAKENISYS